MDNKKIKTDHGRNHPLTYRIMPNIKTKQHHITTIELKLLNAYLQSFSDSLCTALHTQTMLLIQMSFAICIFSWKIERCVCVCVCGLSFVAQLLSIFRIGSQIRSSSDVMKPCIRVEIISVRLWLMRVVYVISLSIWINVFLFSLQLHLIHLIDIDRFGK